MINDNIVITIVEARNGVCKLAIDADRDVKIYREEIYYQIKLANLVGKNANVNSVDSVSDMIKTNDLELNTNLKPSQKVDDIVEKPKGKSIIIRKNPPKPEN